MQNDAILHYLTNEIVPLNDKNDAAHDSRHVLPVMEKCRTFAKQENKNVNMALTTGAFHDTGYATNPENHGHESALILKKDTFITSNFSHHQVRLMAEAIEDHTLKGSSRNPYSEILRHADKRVASAEEWVERSFANLYKKHAHWQLAEFVNDIRQFARKKIARYKQSPGRFLDVEQDTFMVALETFVEIPGSLEHQVLTHLFAAKANESAKQ